MKSLGKKKRRWWQPFVMPVVVISLLVWLCVLSAGYFKKVNAMQGLALTEQAVRKAVLECYAIEGMYPAELSYLQEHYNLTIDGEKYRVSYDCFASNIMPQIHVFER